MNLPRNITLEETKKLYFNKVKNLILRIESIESEIKQKAPESILLIKTIHELAKTYKLFFKDIEEDLKVIILRVKMLVFQRNLAITLSIILLILLVFQSS